MPTSPERKLLATLQEYANDHNAKAWEENKNDALHIEAAFGSTRRHITFDHASKHHLGDLDDEQRANVISHLFANATTWPEGIAEVHCLRDTLQTPTMINEIDFQVFIGEGAVSQGVRISTQMRPR